MSLLFFNGILVTKKGAEDSLDAIKAFYGEKTPQGDKILYDIMYNDTQDKRTDIEETLEQMDSMFLAELIKNRPELLSEIRNNGGKLLERLKKEDPELARLLREKLYIAMLLDEIKSLQDEWHLFSDHPNTEIVYSYHRQKINELVSQNYKMVFVAHSQGNLFAITAYNYAVKQKYFNNPEYQYGISALNSIKVVHIAPTVDERFLKGPYTLADQDLAILTFRGLGIAPTSNVVVPSGLLHFIDEPTGHFLVDTYLQPGFEASYSRIRNHIKTSFEELNRAALSYDPAHFKVNLSWLEYELQSDVDKMLQRIQIWVTEPSGKMVVAHGDPYGDHGYFSSQRPTPEIYYANCDPTKIEGNYRFEMANGWGKIGILSISYYDESKIYKSFDRRYPNFQTFLRQSFNVIVAKDANGKYETNVEYGFYD
jgi:hypothetical protein